jgi:hypothetical protein
MATLSVLEMCDLKTSRSLVRILVLVDAPGSGLEESGSLDRVSRRASGGRFHNGGLLPRRGRGLQMTRRSLFPLWVPAIGLLLVPSPDLLSNTCS